MSVENRVTNAISAYINNDIEFDSDDEESSNETTVIDSTTSETGIIRTLSFISIVSIVLLYASVYSMYVLYNTYNDIIIECPLTYIIYYILSCCILLNLIYYFFLKYYFISDYQYKLLCINLLNILINSCYIICYNFSIDDCIQNKFTNSIYKISSYFYISHYVSIIISSTSLIYCRVKQIL